MINLWSFRKPNWAWTDYDDHSMFIIKEKIDQEWWRSMYKIDDRVLHVKDREIDDDDRVRLERESEIREWEWLWGSRCI